MTIWIFLLASVAAALSIAAFFLAATSRVPLRLLRDVLFVVLFAVPGILVPAWLAIFGDRIERWGERVWFPWEGPQAGLPLVWLSIVTGTFLCGLAALRLVAFPPAARGGETSGPARSRAKRLAGVVLGACGVWLVAVVVLHAHSGARLDAAHEEALRLVAGCRELPRDENGAPLYRQAHELLEPDETGRADVPVRVDEEDAVLWAVAARAYLARHEPALRRVREAVRYPGCQLAPPSPRTLDHPSDDLLLIADCALHGRWSPFPSLTGGPVGRGE